jgi:hypothetical protein
MVSMWKYMEATTISREIMMVADTCFSHLEHALLSATNLSDFETGVSVDPRTVRNTFLNLQVRKKRYSSTSEAKLIQKTVLKDLPMLFNKMAVNYLGRGHWFKTRQEGSIYIMLQEDTFWYGYFLIRNPHVRRDDLMYSSKRV